ncbi:MAG: LacI family DNA-binding transcriptional regulator [Anaerolineales bacterium]|nr:LacI family DNA-binding transcriptional regulator [Anaerolineales bacterium]
MTKRITIADVARTAGVSMMTVSRVVNNKDGVSQETRQQIQEIITKLGYRPSSIARSLVTQRTGTIGLVVPDIANPYFSGIAHGVAEIAHAEGFSVLLCDTEEDPERELDLLEVLEEKRVDGVLVGSPRQSTKVLLPLLKRYPNAVLINRLFDAKTAEIGFVLNDDRKGGYLATRHLITAGHSAIGFLTGPKGSYGSKKRLEGFRQAHTEAGMEVNPNLLTTCSPTVEGGHQSVLQLLEANPGLTALLCFNDMVAIGALQACIALGKKVPADLAIVGYDDIPMASWVNPPLTTMRIPFEEMGRLATQLLINLLLECSENCDNVILEPELIVRASA